MLSSNAVRHRSNNNRSPSPSRNNRNPSKALTIKSESGDSIASSANGKLHGTKRRRDELLRSNKNLFVLAGALFVFALCAMGMWASSASIDGSHSARRIDERANNSNHHSHRKKGKKTRPRGIGRREEEETFLIPKEKIAEPPPIKLDEAFDKGKEKEVHEPRNKNLPRSPKMNARKVESDGSDRNKRHNESNDSDDGGDRTNDEGIDDVSGGTGGEEFSADKRNKEISGVKEDTELSGDEKGLHETKTPSVSRPINIVQMTTGGYQPRVLRLEFEEVSTDEKRSGDEDKDTREDGPKFNFKNVLMTKVHRLPTHESVDMASSERVVSPYPDDDEYLGRLASVKKSKKYRKTEREPLEDKECKPRHEWQKGAFPNCNNLHEFELGQLTGMYGRALREKLKITEGDGGELVSYLAHGYWRDVWRVSKTVSAAYGKESTVLKTLRYKHDFTDRNYDRHRKDALASERLSHSDSVVDIYAYCSNSALYEFGSGGDIEGKLWPYDEKEDRYYVADIPSFEKLDMAYQVAVGIADMHDAEVDGYASIAHTDITPSQFIFIDNKWKLNDFNRCRFMRVYKEDDSPCGFYVGANPGKFRAPEEYEFDEENEMIDVYSMGNIFYAILSGTMPFEGQKEAKAQKKVMDGIRPEIPEEVRRSKDKAIRALVSATKKCWEHKPGNRPSASSIRDELKEVMDRIREKNATKRL